MRIIRSKEQRISGLDVNVFQFVGLNGLLVLSVNNMGRENKPVYRVLFYVLCALDAVACGAYMFRRVK